MLRHPLTARQLLFVGLVSMLWAIGPLLPALWAGQIPGSAATDLYPSVWGLNWFIEHQPGFPTWCTEVAAPKGMPFYYSSPIHGWVGWPIAALAKAAGQNSAVWAYVGTLVLARAATVAVAWGALIALNTDFWPAVGGALLYGASPYFHGYAVEGIIEGTDGWTLPLWVACVARERRAASAAALWLCILSSWYLGMVAVAGAAFWSVRSTTARYSLFGLVAAVPLLLAFGAMATGARPLDDAVRIAMGLQSWLQTPGWAQNNPFAITTWIGVTAPMIALFAARKNPYWVVGILMALLLSTGWGPWYSLPVLRSVRFPYRWHAGTLFLLAVLVARATSQGGGLSRFRWLALLPWLEGYLLSPIEPVLPGAAAKVSRIYEQVRGPLLLDLPGVVALPPGMVNPSRPRARYLMYAQLFHPADSPWVPDFNSVAKADRPAWLDSFAAWEPILDNEGAPLDIEGARRAGVTQILVHEKELRGEAPLLLAALQNEGCTIEDQRDSMVLLAMPAPAP